MHLPPGHGMLFPTALLHSPLFAVLSAFVAINTVMYASLALAKVLPKLYVSDLWTSANRRAQSRSIYPERTAADARTLASTGVVVEPVAALGPADGVHAWVTDPGRDVVEVA